MIVDEAGPLRAGATTVVRLRRSGPAGDLRLERYHLYGKIGAEPYFPTLGRAVDAYQEAHREEDRADWEDSEPGLTW